MTEIQSLNPRQKPPELIKRVYKTFQKLTPDEIDINPEILDFERGLSAEQHEKCQEVDQIHHDTLKSACVHFESHSLQKSWPSSTNVPIFEHHDVPGRFQGRNQALSLRD